MASIRSEYYVDAFRGELDYIWGKTPFAGEIPQMCHARALACSIKRTPQNVARSRRLLFHYMGEFKSGSDKDLINLMYKQLPVSNFIGKYLQNVCTAYKWNPSRSFGKDGSQTDQYAPIYEAARFNRAFRWTHWLLRPLGTVAIRPVVRKSTPKIETMTPDLFRVERDPEDPTEAVAIWYPIEYYGETHLRRMTAEVIEVRDRLEPKKILETMPNAWGEMQWIFVRLQEGDDFYSGGDNDLLEQRMEANAQRFYANLSSKYESHGIMIGTNLGDDDDDDDIQLPPGAIITRNGIRGGDDDELPPDVEIVSGQGQYAEIDRLRRDRIHEELRMKGVPNSNLVENPGAPASGTARLVERMELDDVREEDTEVLALMEQQFKRKLGLAIKEVPVIIDGVTVSGLPVDDTLSIEYVREPVLMEPKDELEHMQSLVDKDVLSVTALVKEFGMQGDISDDDAVDLLRKNRALRLRAAADTDEAQKPAALTSNSLREAVGALVELRSYQEKVKAGTLDREDAIATMITMLGMGKEEADGLFKEQPAKPSGTPTNAPSPFEEMPDDESGE